MKNKRLITGLLLISIIVPIISVPSLVNVFEFIMAFFVIGASIEFLNMFEKESPLSKRFRFVTILSALLIHVSIAGFIGWNQSPITFENRGLLHVTIPFMLVVLFIYFVLSHNFSVTNVGKALLVMIYVGFGSASIVLLRLIGVRFIVYMLIISTLTDTFAYVIGMKFGKHKMTPNISPKKSWEGAIGGSIVATIIASVFAMYYGDIFVVGTFLGDLFNSSGERTLLDRLLIESNVTFELQFLFVFILTFFATIVSQFGDLMASKLKRHYQIKDFGSIFPGHGGIMDRFDSVMLVSMFLSASFFFIYLFI
ncbi:MAG: phosphatidate cytidylyltransferase [Firmicutes bacterium]|nr:phosphatidate cytidylyltransferase [Bacillota bacterium]